MRAAAAPEMLKSATDNLHNHHKISRHCSIHGGEMLTL
ncbi:hypothetical protein SACS_1491 [Parasaccharibacter apium]|uniref:Uncharacterized protein n=1 Tax=Parasaccharibacter apium TaxID=1510841 RepID=A0A7U7G6W8_9PROT|nr:hypothetical protein SACS_1491 [Parasaccharibacter apium]